MKYIITYFTLTMILMTNDVFAGGGITPEYKSEDLNITSILIISLGFILLTALKWRKAQK